MKQKIYKLLSIMLTLAMVLSACVCAIGTASAAGTATYYVSPTGDDTAAGTAVETPLATVDKAINLANAAGYGAGDTVYVKVIHVADQYTKWTAADANGGGTLTAHTFTLDLSSYSDKATIANGAATHFAGPTVISNIKFAWGASNYPVCNIGGNEFVIGSGVETNNGQYNILFAKSGTYTGVNNLTFKGGFTKDVFLGGEWSSPKYNGTINVTYDGSGAYSLILGSSNANAAAHVAHHNGTVNINLKSATAFTLKTQKNANNLAFGAESAVQIINSIGADAAAWKTTLTDETYKPAKYYIINNKSGVAKAVTYTDTVGKFNVNLSSAWSVNITDETGEDVETEIVEGVLDLTALPSGIYNIEAEKTSAEEMTLYASANGDDTADGKTTDTPVKTVNQAIAIAKDAGLAVGDKLTVKVIYVEGQTVAFGSANKASAHPFTLKLMSAGDTKAEVGTGGGFTPGGTLEFENIKFRVGSAGSWPGFHIYGESYHFGAGTVFTGGEYDIVWNSGFGEVFDKDVVLEWDVPMPKQFKYGAWGLPIVNGDTTWIINNSGTNSIYLGASNRTPQINGNLTFIVKKAGSFALTAPDFGAPKTYQLGSDVVIQLLNSSEADVSGAITTIKGLKIDAETYAPYYIYLNKTGIADAIELTDAIGEIKVNLDTERFALLANGEPVEVVEGYAKLEAGEYEFTVDLISPYNTTYYVQTGAENGNGEEATPFATVAEAINAAVASGHIYGDNVTIKLKGEEAVLWGNSEVFAFVPVVESANPEALTKLTMGGAIQGDIVIDDVKLNGSDNNRLHANGHNVTLGAGVENGVQIVTAAQAATIKEEQTITLENPLTAGILVGNSTQNRNTFKSNINYVINNKAIDAGFSFVPYYGGNINIEGNFNVRVIDANSVSFGTTTCEAAGDKMACTVTAAGAQMILPVGLEIGNVENFQAIAPEAYYIIRNEADFDIAFTEYAGELAIDFESQVEKLVVYDAEGAPVDVELDGGILALPAAGEYTLTKECITHDYDDDCDDTCNRCNEVDSERGHTYDFACSEECSVCGEPNEAAEAHTYDDCLDAECNVCSATREAGHIYDNACDADCNSCGEPRTPEDHVYDGPTDTDCNVCGDVRVIADGFIKESGVYYYYENGVKSTDTTLVKVNGSWFYLEEGAWTKTTAIVKYNGVYFYVYKGKWNSKTTDLIKYKGSWFYIKNGKWTKTTDLVKKNGVYFLVKNGKWSSALTTLYKKSGKWFSIKNGKWDKTTQIITYSGSKFYCKGGFAQLGFTGKAKVGSKTYTVVKGKIK